MPKFYFHTDSGEVFCDRLGAQFDDAASAEAAALRLVGQMLMDAPTESWWTDGLVLRLADQIQNAVLIIEVKAHRPG